jgi:hypothetical protein
MLFWEFARYFPFFRSLYSRIHRTCSCDMATLPLTISALRQPLLSFMATQRRSSLR